jgi:hypothetical protein
VSLRAAVDVVTAPAGSPADLEARLREEWEALGFMSFYGWRADIGQDGVEQIRRLLREAGEALRRLSELEQALEAAAETFDDFAISLRLLHHETMAEAAEIARDGTRATLSVRAVKPAVSSAGSEATE